MGPSFGHEEEEDGSHRQKTLALMFPLLSSQHCVAQPAYQLIYPPICLSLSDSARHQPTFSYFSPVDASFSL